MIYYIATYPRSGNSWLQSFIGNNLGRTVTDIYHKPKDDSLCSSDITSAAYDINNLFRTYQNPYEPATHYRALIDGFGTIWNETLRRQVANMDEIFFIKTHEKPYSSYFYGEYVIQVVRHPGACLWSYYHFFRDIVDDHIITLTDIILGRVQFGCWSAYHQAWNETIPHLNDRFLRTKYEQLAGQELSFCHQLATFVGLPILSEEIHPFEHYQQIDPKYFRHGKTSGWEDYYSPKELELLQQRHGQMMSLLAYPTMIRAKKADPPLTIVPTEKPKKNISLILKQLSILQQVQAGHAQEAINALIQLLDTQPDNAVIHNDLGVLICPLAEPNAHERALEHLERAYNLAPTDVNILENLIKIYQLLGKDHEALDTLTIALVQSNEPTYLSKIAQLYALLGYEEKAKQLQSTIVTSTPPVQQSPNPTTGQPQITLTIAQPTILQAVQAGQVNETIMQLREHLNLQPNNALNHNDLGTLLFAQEQTRTQGFDHLKIALSLQPDHAVIVRNLARVYTLFKRNEEAKSLWETLLRLRPDEAEAKEALSQFITIASGLE